MNHYGAQAMRHWQSHLPTRFTQITDPETFFTELGEQVETEVEELTFQLAGDDPPPPPGEPASFLDKAYEDTLGWKVSVPAYALATFVSLARVERRKHWASDVAAGAAIGFLIGNLTASAHYGEGGVNRRFEIAPVVTPDGVSIVANLRF